MNILIKLMSIVSLIIAPHLSEGVSHTSQNTEVKKEVKIISAVNSTTYSKTIKY